MGPYLSSPNKQKNSEDGQNSDVSHDTPGKHIRGISGPFRVLVSDPRLLSASKISNSHLSKHRSDSELAQCKAGETLKKIHISRVLIWELASPILVYLTATVVIRLLNGSETA